MEADGSPARRMTWLGPDVMVRGWTPEGQILFITTYGQPFFRNYRAHTLDPQGGLPQLLPLGQVNHLAFGPGKAKVIGRNTADPARWKRYRGGTAGCLWIDAEGSGVYRRMTELKGNITSPMWLGGRVFFLSDAEGVGNLYSCLPSGTDLRRHTDHDDYYARHAQTDGKRIVYQCGAELWLFDPAADRSERLDVRLPSHRTQAARRFVAATEHLESFHPHPAGHSLAVVARGKLFTFPLWEGAVRQHGSEGNGRYRHGQWLSDGTTVVAIGDASGEERMEVFEEGRARTLPWEVGRVIAMAAAPRGRRVALANHRNEVLLGDLDSGELTRSTAATRVAPRSSPGRRTGHGLPTPSGPRRGTPRSSSTTWYEGGGARHAVRIPRLQPGVRSARALPVLPLGAHLRPGLRQRAVRVELPSRGEALLDRPAGGRPDALRPGAEGSQARGPELRGRQGQRGRGVHDGGPRGDRRAGRGVSGGGEPVWPDRRRGRGQGRLDGAADCRRARARRAQGFPGPAGRLRPGDAARRDLDGKGRRLRHRRRPRHAAGARRQAPARDRGEPQAGIGARSAQGH